MIYEYDCPACGRTFDVVKSAEDYKRAEFCACGREAQRNFLPTRLYFSGTAVQEAEYNPGLGCIVKNKQHRQEICRQRGLEEIGNEKAETLHRHFDKAREERRERAWAEVDKGWVGEG